MDNFDFYNPTKILFGKDRLAELDQNIPKGAKVLVLYGGGSVKKYGTLDKVLKALGSREILEFPGIEPNPSYETLMKAVEVVRKESIDFLLAVGGGSVIDGTKFIAVASRYEGDDHSQLLKNPSSFSSEQNPVSIGTVLTLPATGSEMNEGAVITYGGCKYVVTHPQVCPQFSFLDPTLTYTLPAIQVANGVIDAFVHVCEQYVTYPAQALFQDRMAEGILLLLIEIGKKTIDNPQDYELRANLMWNATMALNGLLGSGVPQDWSTHMIGHQLTASFGIDHAQTLAIIQPSVWMYRKEQKQQKLLQYARRVWKTDDIDDAIENTRSFFESLGVKTRMSDHSIKKEDIDNLIADLERSGVTTLSETNDLTLDDIRKILELSL